MAWVMRSPAPGCTTLWSDPAVSMSHATTCRWAYGKPRAEAMLITISEAGPFKVRCEPPLRARAKLCCAVLTAHSSSRRAQSDGAGLARCQPKCQLRVCLFQHAQWHSSPFRGLQQG